MIDGGFEQVTTQRLAYLTPYATGNRDNLQIAGLTCSPLRHAGFASIFRLAKERFYFSALILGVASKVADGCLLPQKPHAKTATLARFLCQINDGSQIAPSHQP